jgi:hypothetical protein
MAEPVLRNSGEIAAELLREQGIRAFSLLGGVRAEHYMAWAIDRAREEDRQRRADSPGESETLYLKDGDWAFDIDDDSCSEEAWWVELQLFDPEDESDQVRTVIAELSLSDVELEGLITAATDILSEGRARFS